MKGHNCMKKILNLAALAIILSINILGCGKAENITSSSSNAGADENISINNNNNDNLDNDNLDKNIPDNNKNNNKTSNTQPPETTLAPEENIEPKIFNISGDKPYSDINKAVTILGLKEYKKLESSKYTDIPKNGKKFLVLFLSIRNDSHEDYYINYKYLSAKVNGKKVENTFLVNEPKNYTSIFNHIEPGRSSAGFIVWEVPAGWKKLEIVYDGWKDIDNISLKAEFTPNDLSSPLIYNPDDYL